MPIASLESLIGREHNHTPDHTTIADLLTESEHNHTQTHHTTIADLLKVSALANDRSGWQGVRTFRSSRRARWTSRLWTACGMASGNP